MYEVAPEEIQEYFNDLDEESFEDFLNTWEIRTIPQKLEPFVFTDLNTSLKINPEALQGAIALEQDNEGPAPH